MIRFEEVSKTYQGQAKAALRNVSVEIAKGEFTFLVGASGSGKSTFLRLVLREYLPSSGHIWVAGKDLARLHSWKVPALRRQIGTLIRRVVPETLELVGLDDKAERLPEELSGGEQQRVAIARAFVNRPAILIADEPTGNLDPATSVGIMKLLDRINKSDTTVIMATHDASIVDQMRKRVIELVDGEVVRDQSKGVYGYR
jgi:cell division transport system ATP-binding protein